MAGRSKLFRVVYRYDNGVSGRNAHDSLDSAEIQAGQIGSRGAATKLLYVTPGAPGDKPLERAVGTFGPGIVHAPVSDHSGDRYYVCGCGARRAAPSGMEDHMSRAGTCRLCWGQPVHQAADGTPVDCPVCNGTGREEETSYHGVDTGAYLTASRYIQPGKEAR